MESDKSPAGFAFKFDNLRRLQPQEWTVSAYRSVNGGGTGEEFTENLQKAGNTPGNKWYDGSSGETWINAYFHTPKHIKFIQLRSGNDCPERDPYKITFLADDNKISEIDDLIFEERYQSKDFNIDTNGEVSNLKIVINSNYSNSKNGNWGSGTQLCEVIFFE